MNELNQYFPVIVKVLSNPYVIGTAIVVFFYIDFCVFVANYRKRPKIRHRPVRTVTHTSEAKPSGEGEETSASDGAGET